MGEASFAARATAADLPPAPPGGTGWPRAIAHSAPPHQLPGSRAWPRITIVTPSFNQEQFVEQTICSVLDQGYPNLEYMVVDGGSTDGTVDIIRRYSAHLAYWVSEPDRGQSSAINKALERATGQWFNWLNSDDILLPGALWTLAEIAALAADAQWITGGSLLMAENGTLVGCQLPWRSLPHVMGLNLPNFPQDATFINLDFLRQHGLRARDDLHNVMDTYLHWQLLRFCRPVVTTAVLSGFRVHGHQKTQNVERLHDEGRRILGPLMRERALPTRLLYRLQGFRYLGFLVSRALGLGLRVGVLPGSNEWIAAVPDGSGRLMLSQARKHVWF